MSYLQLSLTDYQDETRWRWVLSNAEGNFLADHEVELDNKEPKYQGFADLYTYVKTYTLPTYPMEQVLEDVGQWMGQQVFGGLLEVLREERDYAGMVTVVQVRVPKEAQDLLFRPFELAYLDGEPFAQRGIRFVYQLVDAIGGQKGKPGKQDLNNKPLRVLAVFSLPDQASPLNLRRERYGLKRLVEELQQTGRAMVELRIIQYGATRKTLSEAFRQGGSWDVIHLSGHGLSGQLMLEDSEGKPDIIQADELAKLLDPTRPRLKLLTLSACLSGAGSLQQAHAMLGLSSEQARTRGVAAPAAQQTGLPSLAQELSQALGCAALAMRYPVGDSFATQLALELYDSLFNDQQPLPHALQIALDDALDADAKYALSPSPLSQVTPILFGTQATDLLLTPPSVQGQYEVPTTGLFYFEPEPERFVGRVLPMLRASQALAPRSNYRGVLFYGMAGAGKTTCALELAYRHEVGRFQGYVWFKAPDDGYEIHGTLANFLQSIENQLALEQRGILTAHLNDPQNFSQRTLPHLQAILRQHATLIVIDNIESLLSSTGILPASTLRQAPRHLGIGRLGAPQAWHTAQGIASSGDHNKSGGWRDPKWGTLIDALLTRTGESRLVLTSRRLPTALEQQPNLLRLPIHALSLGESVLLARELDHLHPLFGDETGRTQLQHTLNLAQGHPKLLELADKMAANGQLATLTPDNTPTDNQLYAFFRTGESQQSAEDFIATLRHWTTTLIATLPPTARLLFYFLCRLSEEDRRSDIIKANWEDFLKRLVPTSTIAATALNQPNLALHSSLAALVNTGLVKSRTVELPDSGLTSLLLLLASNSQLVLQLKSSISGSQYQPTDKKPVIQPFHRESKIVNLLIIHPAIAETGRDTLRQAQGPADAIVLEATDIELGNFWIIVGVYGEYTEMQGGTPHIMTSARRAAPYLLRRERWHEAGIVLESMINRGQTPAHLSFALPLLRKIVNATQGTESEAIDVGRFATALFWVGQHAEAEPLLRDTMAKSVARGDYKSASAMAGRLISLLRVIGRYDDALKMAEQAADYTRRAGLGLWAQLLDEAQRLQILNALGRYDEILKQVQALRPQLTTQPSPDTVDEGINPWNVREGMLDIGAQAARRLKKWQTALDLNAECLASQRQRGANQVEMARTRLNDYGALLSLRRYTEARTLLMQCRTVAEQANHMGQLGRAFSALADLEDELGNHAAAVQFEQSALRYKYQAGEIEDRALSHNNLANSLEWAGGAANIVLAHRLAACIIALQTQSGALLERINRLANSAMPITPPTFDEVVAGVEQIEGVRFRTLFANLPKRVPNGDAAIMAVWQLAKLEQAKKALHGLPPAIITGLLSGDSEKVVQGLIQLPPKKREAAMAQIAASAKQLGYRENTDE